MNKFQVWTICGSMRYHHAMLTAAEALTRDGCIVLMPFVAISPEEQVTSEVKTMLDEMHQVKIDMSCGIIVVGSHRGESTLSEIEYARKTGKTIVEWGDL